MTAKDRLKTLSDRVKSAGLSGGSMQAAFEKVVADNDLTSHEIDRIAEMANREVQLELYKTATDKRFKFELADPAPLKAAARKTATTVTHTTKQVDQAKVAAVSPEGDPFVAPYRSSGKLSLFEAPIDEKRASEHRSLATRELLQRLDRERLKFAAVISEGQLQMQKIGAKAEQTFKGTVQSAMDLIAGGVTLPSLYQAVVGATSGGMASDESKKTGDQLMSMIIDGLKKRGIPNHKMGFKHKGDVVALDKLGADDLMYLCKRSTGRIYETDITMDFAKNAQYLERMADFYRGERTTNMVDEAEQHSLFDRASVKKYPCPQPYLDEKWTDNMPGGRVVAFNTDNEFVIGITDLMGDQSRMTRLHSANEYMGLKLKQIEHQMRDMKTAQATIDNAPVVAEEKQAAGFAAGLRGVGSTLLTQAKKDPLTALGHGVTAASVGAMALPYIAKPKMPDESKLAIAPLIGMLTRGVAAAAPKLLNTASTAMTVGSMLPAKKPEAV